MVSPVRAWSRGIRVPARDERWATLAIAVLVAGPWITWALLPRTDLALNIAALPMLAAGLLSVGAGGVAIAALRWWGRGLLLLGSGTAWAVVLMWMIVEGSGVGT